MFAKRRRTRQRGLRLFFATDIHGSERCFRKFLNAATHYDVDHLIMGGDITGKVIVPVVEHGAGYSANVGEHVYTDLGRQGWHELEARIRAAGQYPYVGSREEIEALAEPTHREAVFRQVVTEEMSRWVELADAKLKGTGRKCFVAPGNDDFMEIDEPLQGSDVVVFAEGKCLRVDSDHEMITTGYSNPTPWDTEREMSEAELEAYMDAMMANVTEVGGLITVLHAPPFDTELDHAPKLNQDLRMSADAGGVVLAPVGSTAVRRLIELNQPLIGLHGHVHDSRGVVQIGRTVCLNPGSEYTEGILNGAIVELGPEAVLSRQLVSG